jgi:CubicO group peptidase (beta-lactamase class C family)
VTSVEEGGPVTPDTLFRIGSLTKPLTAALILKLVERGDLELDRPIVEYLPWFGLSAPGAARAITLRHLLTHTAGLPTDGMDLGPDAPPTLVRYVREIVARYPLVARPGVVCSYSNAGYNVAGCVAEVVADWPYPRLIADLIFAPLGMERTTFDPAVAMTYPLALPHELDAAGAPRVRHRLAINAAHAPCGEAFSTVRDLASFCLLHLRDGRYDGRQLLSPAALELLHRQQADLYTAGGWSRGSASSATAGRSTPTGPVSSSRPTTGRR